jgi:hypothetical protein
MTDQSFGANPVGGSAAPCAAGQESHWIEIELVGEDDKPIAGEAYRITLPDGATVLAGTLDDNGRARVDGLAQAGSCKITFPALDQEAWQDLSQDG